MAREKQIYGMVTIGTKGQVVLPKKVREHFGFVPGDTLLVLGDESSTTGGLTLVGSDAFLSAAGPVINTILKGE